MLATSAQIGVLHGGPTQHRVTVVKLQVDCFGHFWKCRLESLKRGPGQLHRLEACLQTEVQKLDGLPHESTPEGLPFNLSRPGACCAGPPQHPSCTPALSTLTLSSRHFPQEAFFPSQVGLSGAGTLALAVPRPGCRSAPPSTRARRAAGVCRLPGAGRREVGGQEPCRLGSQPFTRKQAEKVSCRLQQSCNAVTDACPWHSQGASHEL